MKKNNFISMVSFEYKKVFMKKGVYITIFLTLALSLFSCFATIIGKSYLDGEEYETHYEAMKKDRAYARALSGRAIDKELMEETMKAYSGLSKTEGKEARWEYQNNARPYSSIFNIMRSIYNMDLTDMVNLSEEQMNDFYNIRYQQQQIRSIESVKMSQRAIDAVLMEEKQIKTPFIFSYTDGYTRFFGVMFINGILISLAIAICITPLFSGEYMNGMAQLILSSKHGKRTLIQSKIFMGLSFSALLTLIYIFLSFILCLLVLGTDGMNAPIQLYYPMFAYSLTMAQAAILYSICIFFGNLLIAAITMILSAKMKNSFGVIIIVGILIVLPMFINLDGSNLFLYNLSKLIPNNMMDFSKAFDTIQYDFFGLIIKPYVFFPLVSAIVILITIPFTYRGFKNHQIS